MPPIVGLLPRTAVRVKQLVEDGGSTVTDPRAATPARGVTWVKVTGSPTAGWHPAVVSLDKAGTFEDLTVAVKVAAADGSTLTTGNRYPCTRTGDDAGGVARFRTLPDAAAGAFLAELATSSAGLWKWYRVINDVATGSLPATFNAKPAKIDGVNLLNPVTGLRVWMWASGGATPYDFLPIGYAAANFGGLIQNASQHIPAPKLFDDYVTVNDTHSPVSAAGLGTGEKVAFRAWAAQLGGDAVAALQSVDSYTSSSLSGRAVYVYREVWNGTATESVPHALYAGGAAVAKGNPSAFTAAGFDAGNTYTLFTSPGGLIAATTHTYPDSAEWLQWNVIPGQFLGIMTTGYTAFGKSAMNTHYLAGPGGTPAASDLYHSLVFGQKGKHDGGLGCIYFVVDGSTYTRVATTQGFAVITAAGNLVDGVDGTTPGGDTVQGGIITAIGTAPTLPALPTTGGPYTLRCTVTGGVPSLAWV
jgi:hypothetical protein